MKIFAAFLSLCSANNDLHTDGVLDFDGQDFKSLSRKEQENLLEKIFDKMDTKRDGLVDRQEMLDWTWHIEKKYMTEDVDNWVSIWTRGRFLFNGVLFRNIEGFTA